jgi:TPP-dependent pyruvate/acetoin dehydrogenase alpha subunit
MTTARARTREEAGAPEELLGLLRQMMLIRRFEEASAPWLPSGRTTTS